MKWLVFFITALILAISANASISEGYAPREVKCPSKKTLVRKGDSISLNETKWIKERQKKTEEGLVSFLDKANLTDFDAKKFIMNSTNSSQPLNIGLAFSGGGYRSMLSGAGQLAALDNRTEDGHAYSLGGVLQSSTYISGLSGGAWMLGSLVMEDWPTVENVIFENPDDLWNLTSDRQLVNTSQIWKIGFPLLAANLNGALTHMNHWMNGGNGIVNDLESKNNARFPTTLTDAWARGLAYQLFSKGKDNHKTSAKFSDIRNKRSFVNHDMPFPILNALARDPKSVVYNENSTVIEFNPYEMGSFDPSIHAFTDIKYLGTKVDDGVPLNGTCIEGFDNAGFVIGTSSSLFNQFINTLACEDCTTLNFILKPIVKRYLTRLSRKYEDVAIYKPNPFYKSKYGAGDVGKNSSLYLFDGGLGGQVIPLATMMTKERAMDTVFAFDNDGWANGSSLVATYTRQFSEQGASQLCPYVPNEQNFLYQNLTAKPTFFGCDASNMTDLKKDGVTPPLVIYIANRPFEFWSNTSTFKMSYTDGEKKGMIKNGFDVATRLNQTLDSEWSTCVACALVRREQERRGIEQSDQCKKCFKEYCWDGKSFEFDHTYYTPLNFTMTGKTNSSMTMKTIHSLPVPSGTLWSILKKRFVADEEDNAPIPSYPDIQKSAPIIP